MFCSKTKKNNLLVLSPTQEFLNSQAARCLKPVKGVDFTTVLMLAETRVAYQAEARDMRCIDQAQKFE